MDYPRLTDEQGTVIPWTILFQKGIHTRLYREGQECTDLVTKIVTLKKELRSLTEPVHHSLLEDHTLRGHVMYLSLQGAREAKDMSGKLLAGGLGYITDDENEVMYLKLTDLAPAHVNYTDVDDIHSFLGLWTRSLLG